MHPPVLRPGGHLRALRQKWEAGVRVDVHPPGDPILFGSEVLEFPVGNGFTDF